MRINNKSLLWRLYSVYALDDVHRWHSRTATSVGLCKYVRGIIRGIFVAFVSILLGAILGVIALEAPVSAVLYFTHGMFGPFYGAGDGSDMFLTIISSALWVIIIGITVIGMAINAATYVQERFPNIIYSSSNEDQEPGVFGLVSEYIAAVHNKMCPVLTVYDPNDNPTEPEDDIEDIPDRM